MNFFAGVLKVKWQKSIFQSFVMLYDSVTKQVRNSYKYSWDSAGFGPDPKLIKNTDLSVKIHYTSEVLDWDNGDISTGKLA